MSTEAPTEAACEGPLGFNHACTLETHVDRLDGLLACLAVIHFQDEMEGMAVNTIATMLGESRDVLRKLVKAAIRPEVLRNE